MNQKGLAPVLIFLILAALVGGYLVYQKQVKPTPSPQPTTQPYNQDKQGLSETSLFQKRLAEHCGKIDGALLLQLRIEVDQRVFPSPRASCEEWGGGRHVDMRSDENKVTIALYDSYSKLIPRGGGPDFGPLGIPIKTSKDGILFFLSFGRPEAGFMGPDTLSVDLTGDISLDYFYNDKVVPAEFQDISLTGHRKVMGEGDEELRTFLEPFVEKSGPPEQSPTMKISEPELVHEFLNRFPKETAENIAELERTLKAVSAFSRF